MPITTEEWVDDEESQKSEDQLPLQGIQKRTDVEWKEERVSSS